MADDENTTPTGEAESDAPIPDDRPWRKREYSGAGSTLGVAALVVIVVAVAIWFLEFRGDDGPATASDGTGIIDLPDDLNPTDKSPSAEVGRAAPNFRLKDLQGQDVELTDFRGEPVLVNFWASWCLPCRGETPELESVYKDRGLTILGVNNQERPEDAAGFRDEFGVTYPLVLDTDAEVALAYRVPGIPVSVLIDKDGVVRNIFLSRVTTEQLDKALAELNP